MAKDTDDQIEEKWASYSEGKLPAEILLPAAIYKLVTENIMEQIDNIDYLLKKYPKQSADVALTSYREVMGVRNNLYLEEVLLQSVRKVLMTEIGETILDNLYADGKLTDRIEGFVGEEVLKLTNKTMTNITDERITQLIAPDHLRAFNRDINGVYALCSSLDRLNQLCAKDPWTITEYTVDRLTPLGSKRKMGVEDDNNAEYQQLKNQYLIEISKIAKEEITAQVVKIQEIQIAHEREIERSASEVVISAAAPSTDIVDTAPRSYVDSLMEDEERRQALNGNSQEYMY